MSETVLITVIGSVCAGLITLGTIIAKKGVYIKSKLCGCVCDANEGTPTEQERRL